MLVPIRTSGDKPPLFFVHGMHGDMPLGTTFARTLGPDQPVYAIYANGMDAQQPALDDMEQMVATYLAEIQAARPSGSIRIGGMCHGCLIAIEMVRELRQAGRVTGMLILADPPVIAPGYDKRNHRPDQRQPEVVRQLYIQSRRFLLHHAASLDYDIPFDINDPKQLHAATLAAVGSLVACSMHVPKVFSGPVELIISAERASRFFHPQMPWSHDDLFREGRDMVARLIAFMLGDAAQEQNSNCVPPDIAAAHTMTGSK